MNKLPAVAQRLIAVSILLFVILFAFYLLKPLLDVYGQTHSEVQSLSDRLVRYRALIAKEELIEEQLAKLDQDVVRGSLFLEGNKESIASANMQDFITRAVKDSGGQLSSTQDYQPDSGIEGGSPIGLRVQFAGETGNLINLLYQLESARPLIFIDELTITASTRRQSSRDIARRRSSRQRGRPQAPRYSLDVRMDLICYQSGGG